MALPETRVITAYIPLPLAEQVDQLAIRLDCSRGWIINQALSAFVELEERHYRMTIEGLDDVDTKRTVDQVAVEAWVASLETDAPLPTPDIWIDQ